MQNKKIVLFYPYLPDKAKDEARKQMDTRWHGQGIRVDEFELLFEERISHSHKAVAVNSGTSALHLADILAGIKDGDEVIGPVFSCSASYSGLLYQRAKVVFADINRDNLNINPNHVEELFRQRGERIKAIIAVDYGGYPCDYDRLLEISKKWNVPIIEDAAQAIGAKYKGRNIGEICPFTAFSFQAVKILETADGGILTLEDHMLEEKAKRLRWFGIDRKAKFADRWKKDISEIGYKYQMTDISATLGIEGLKQLEQTMAHYKKLFTLYREKLEGIPGIRLMNKDMGINDDTNPSYWLCTVEADKRDDLKRKLADNGIESDPTHYRNDRYTVYGGRVYNCPNMDYLEDRYLLLPMHYYVTEEDVEYITNIIKLGW